MCGYTQICMCGRVRACVCAGAPVLRACVCVRACGDAYTLPCLKVSVPILSTTNTRLHFTPYCRAKLVTRLLNLAFCKVRISCRSRHGLAARPPGRKILVTLLVTLQKWRRVHALLQVTSFAPVRTVGSWHGCNTQLAHWPNLGTRPTPGIVGCVGTIKRDFRYFRYRP